MDTTEINDSHEQAQSPIYVQNDVPSIGLNIMSFILPLLGLIFWCVYANKSPIKAKSIGKSALIGLAVGIVLNIIIAML